MSLYVVTGGAGFIGSHLAAHLGQAGHDVRVLDNGSGARAQRLSAVPHLEFFDGDVRDAALCRRVCQGAEFVLHLAAVQSDDAAECASVNVGGTIALLDAARAAQTVKRFVFTSSGAVYGDAPGGARHEASLPDPLSPAASSLLSAELFCRSAFRQHGLHAVVLRLFSIYGPGQSADSLIARFCAAVRQNRPLTIEGDGEQTRDFLFVSDAVEACLRTVHAQRGTGGKTFNIGSGQRTTVNQLAEKMARMTGRKLLTERQAARVGDIRHARADIAAAAGLLQFAPTVTLDDGLARTLQNYSGAQREEKRAA